MSDRPVGELFAEPCRRALQHTVDRLEHGLTSFAIEADSSERLHDLRVALRRTESALFVCQSWLRKRHRRWFQKQCRKLRRASNAVRDCDVALTWLNEQGSAPDLVKRIEREREKAIDNLSPMVARLIEGRKFTRHRRRLFKEERSDGIGPLAAQLAKLSGQFTELAGKAMLDPLQLHRWRITGKKLRYALDFLGDLGCVLETKDALAALKQLQDQIGAATDAVSRRRLLARASDGEDDDDDDQQEILRDCCDLATALNYLERAWAGSLAAARWCAAGV